MANSTEINRQVIMTCAVTGAGDTVGKHPAIPVTPKQIAEAALEAASAGAAVAHIHVRDPETGKTSRNPALYREVMDRIRASGSDVIVNLTAGMGGDLLKSSGASAISNSCSRVSGDTHSGQGQLSRSHMTSNMTLAAMMEPFRIANRMVGRRLFDWSVLSEAGTPIVSSRGLRINQFLRRIAVPNDNHAADVAPPERAPDQWPAAKHPCPHNAVIPCRT
jgi:hypothetical protein